MLGEVVGKLVFEWEGMDISLNKFYSSPHWTIRSKEKANWQLIFSSIPILDKRRVNEYYLEIRYNSRLDVDNTILHGKFLIDYLRGINILIDDNTKYYKGLVIIYDNTMNKKHYIITLNVLSYHNENN